MSDKEVSLSVNFEQDTFIEFIAFIIIWYSNTIIENDVWFFVIRLAPGPSRKSTKMRRDRRRLRMKTTIPLKYQFHALLRALQVIPNRGIRQFEYCMIVIWFFVSQLMNIWYEWFCWSDPEAPAKKSLRRKKGPGPGRDLAVDEEDGVQVVPESTRESPVYRRICVRF